MNRIQLETLPERTRYLVLAAAAPTAWMLHFLLSYITVAVWCARVAGMAGPLVPLYAWIAAYTVVALAVIGVVGWGGYRRHRSSAGRPPHDEDSPGDRHQFLGYIAFLLAVLSAIATVYSALAVFAFQTC